MKIFLLEDDHALNKVITSSLQQKGFFVESCPDGYKAVNIVLNQTFDIYILDINVPGFNGHQVLEVVRQNHEILPVIIISAAMDIENIEKAYELGCNDYLKKPFAFEELYIRIKYLIKTLHEHNLDHQIIELGYGYKYEYKSQTLFQFENEIILSQNEKLLLDFLVNNIGKTVPIEHIHDYVWGDKFVEAVSMRSLMYKVQKKLKNGMIINVRGVGYKLNYTPNPY